jgi:ectoine hydroxylase-related dioxygenase (phytanoyl-CoA dioxygenase family)
MSSTIAESQFTIHYVINDGKKNYPVRDVIVDATRDEMSHLVNDGYVIRRGLVKGDWLERMRAAVDRLTEIETKQETGEHIPGNGFYLRHLMDKDETFLEWLTFKPTLSVARAALGPQVFFDVEARVAFANAAEKRVPWHIHHRLVPNPMPPFFMYPHAINGLLYLDPVGDLEGPLAVLPGSHRQHDLRIPDNDNSDREGQILLTWEPGDCIIFHVNLWHRTVDTKPGCGPRRVVIFGYQPSWLKSEVRRGVKVDSTLTDRVRASGDPEMIELLDGFHW